MAHATTGKAVGRAVDERDAFESANGRDHIARGSWLVADNASG